MSDRPYRSRLEIMRHIYNCEQISIPRAVSYNEMSDASSQHSVMMTSDTQHSSFDESIPTPTSKGQFDFTSKARFVHVVFGITIVRNDFFCLVNKLILRNSRAARIDRRLSFFFLSRAQQTTSRTDARNVHQCRRCLSHVT
jgi:hypothetical protein